MISICVIGLLCPVIKPTDTQWAELIDAAQILVENLGSVGSGGNCVNEVTAERNLLHSGKQDCRQVKFVVIPIDYK